MRRMNGSSLQQFGLRTMGMLGMVGFAGLTGCVTGGLTFDETRLLEADYHDPMGLDVQTRNGSVTIRKGEGDLVRITAKLKARSQERLIATRISAEHDDAGSLVVRVAWPDGGRMNNEGCSFVIETPGADGARVDTGNGAISISGLAGEADLDTSNGAIEVVNHSGPIFAETSNGRVTMRNVDGPVEASTSNGSVSVELAESMAGAVHITTSNGAVRLVLSPVFTGELELETSNGGISYETLPSVTRVSARRNHAVLQFGEDGPSSHITTSNGSITLKAPIAHP